MKVTIPGYTFRLAVGPDGQVDVFDTNRGDQYVAQLSVRAGGAETRWRNPNGPYDIQSEQWWRDLCVAVARAVS